MALNSGLEQVLRFFTLGGFGIAFLLLVGPSVQAGHAVPLIQPMVVEAATSGLLQFHAQGHILGFHEGGFYVSNATFALHVEFLGAKPVAPVSEKTGGFQWEQRGTPPLSRVTYPSLWDGITLAYDGTRGGVVSSSYRVEAGVDPGAIHLRYNAPVTLNENGSLTIAFATGEMSESAPVAWQEVAGERVAVPAEFRLRGDSEVGFGLGDYDAGQPLFIDPTLMWNTFLGGGGWDDPKGIVVDGIGNAYVVGGSNATWGSPLNAFAGGDDGFVAKLSPSGELMWNTFFGGSGNDAGDGIAVDSSGSIYVAGTSNGSWGSPILPFMGDYDAFAAKLSPTGELTWNTFLGERGPDGGRAVAADDNGNVYVAGDSDRYWGAPVRTHMGLSDAFVVKLNSGGALLWNTFLGGTGYDYGSAIAVDGSENVYVAGYSSVEWGSPVRAFDAGNDAFAAKLSPTGELTWNTFLGGGGYDSGYAITVDGGGNIYVGGSSSVTWGSPVRAFGGGNDAFAAKLDSRGTMMWNTFLGGSGFDHGFAIAVDSSENIYVAGSSDASWGSPLRAYMDRYDAFAAKLSPGGGLTWNAFLGGDKDDWGGAVAVDASGNVYVAGSVDSSWGSPVRSYTSGRDAFVAKIGAFDGYLPLIRK